jgi:hypothetical protein
LTRETKNISEGMASALCTLWVHPRTSANPGIDQKMFSAQAIDMLKCQK